MRNFLQPVLLTPVAIAEENVKSGLPSIATTVVEGPKIGSTAAKPTSSAIATGVRSAGTNNGPHRLSPLTK